MNDSLEHILNDIYALDPSLKESDGEVRVLVSALLEAKPGVAPSESFVRELRSKLQSVSLPKIAPKPILSPWLMYLTPVGVMAVLVLILVPNYLSAPTTMPSDMATPQLMEDEVQSESMEMDTFEAANGYDMKRSVPGGEPEASVMQMTSMMAPTDSSFLIPTQQPGMVVLVEFAALNYPGFIVIQESLNGQPGGILGVSIFLKEGLTEQVQIMLQRPMGLDETFFATAYLDNGDERFNPETDTPLYDSSGTLPLQQMFSTLPR